MPHVWTDAHRAQVTALAKALGIEDVERVTGFTLRVHVGEISTLTIERHVSNGEIEAATQTMLGYAETPSAPL